MTPNDLEQRAERAVRRGELLAAIEHFESYLAQQPDDERVRLRMESVRALLQPSEMVSRRRVEPEEPGETQNELSDAEMGEMFAASGRFDDAAKSYARAVAANPRNELLRERFDELRALAQPEARAALEGAEKLEGAAMPTPGRGSPRLARSARASEASFAPLRESAPPPVQKLPTAKPLPQDPIAMLRDLLQRIQSARRPR
jgi:tetratricopeptide (TPR) repeat protein